jgi:hypothetical protein
MRFGEPLLWVWAILAGFILATNATAGGIAIAFLALANAIIVWRKYRRDRVG